MGFLHFHAPLPQAYTNHNLIIINCHSLRLPRPPVPLPMPIIRDQRMLGVSTLARELGRQKLYLSKIDNSLVLYLSSLIFDKFDI